MTLSHSPIIGCYLTVQSQIEALARRWVAAYEGCPSLQGYSVNCVTLSYHNEIGTISFSYRHCDGVQWPPQGSTQIPATYLDNDSTLESDARAAKQALHDKWAAEQAEQRTIESDPAVRKYLDWQGRRGYSMSRSSFFPYS